MEVKANYMYRYEEYDFVQYKIKIFDDFLYIYCSKSFVMLYQKDVKKEKPTRFSNSNPTF